MTCTLRYRVVALELNYDGREGSMNPICCLLINAGLAGMFHPSVRHIQPKTAASSGAKDKGGMASFFSQTRLTIINLTI